MTLRIKLVLILSALVISAAVLASSIVYLMTQSELEQTAEVQLHRSATLLAELVQHRFDAELREFEHWAAMPLVVNTALNSKSIELTNAFERYFSRVIEREPYTSIYLIDRSGDCVACDDPRRLHHPHCHEVVSQTPTALMAFKGKAGIGRSQLSRSTERPVVPLSAPVWHAGAVIAILRTSVDMGRMMAEMLTSLPYDTAGRLFLYDPSLPNVLPNGDNPQLPSLLEPYQPPPEAMQRALQDMTNDVLRYEDHGQEHVAGRATMSHPAWVFLVSRPLADILAPIHTLRQITVSIITLFLLFLIAAIFLITIPMVRGIKQCRELADEISAGRLDRRLNLHSNDEIGELAGDLNRMAEQLQIQRRSLEEAELKYRTIFEKAVEGIFQTTASGEFMTANAALASILGADSPNQLIGKSVLDFYAHPELRAEMIAQLKRDGKVDSYAVEQVQLDGRRCSCELTARAELDEDGKLIQIYGILLDVTERRLAEAAKEHARETERLLIEARWQTLRHQLNPHFIFNVLTSVEALSREAPKKIPNLTRRLATYLRLTLEPGEQPLVPAERERTALQSYLDIEKIRFEELLDVEFDFDDDIGSLLMPDLLLQPLVENALKFGMATSAMPLKVRVRAWRKHDRMTVRVENTGRWVTNTHPQRRSRIGFDNLRARLTLLYGTDYQLKTETQDGWVWVTVNVPIRESVSEGNKTKE